MKLEISNKAILAAVCVVLFVAAFAVTFTLPDPAPQDVAAFAEDSLSERTEPPEYTVILQDGSLNAYAPDGSLFYSSPVTAGLIADEELAELYDGIVLYGRDAVLLFFEDYTE